MIEVISALPEGTIGFRATGKVTGEDYDNVLTKAIDDAMIEFDHIKMLAVFGPDFEGYSLKAAWDDTRLGMRHWTGFERIAVATDTFWLKHAIKAMGFMLPCPVKLFDLDELDDAQRWLQESLGTIHVSTSGKVTTVQLIGKLEASAYDEMDAKIDDAFSATESPCLLVDLREFDGWTGLSALGQHLAVVRKHHRQPQRIAIVGDETWQRVGEKILSRFVNAKTHFFDQDDYDGARAWVEKT